VRESDGHADGTTIFDFVEVDYREGHFVFRGCMELSFLPKGTCVTIAWVNPLKSVINVDGW
jgi:hypothetical protein